MNIRKINKNALKMATNEIDKNFDTNQMKKSLEIATELRNKGAIDVDTFEKIKNISEQQFSTKREYLIKLKFIEALLEDELRRAIMSVKK